MSYAMIASAAIGVAGSSSEGKKNRSAAADAASASNPFGPYRDEYAQKLQFLMYHPKQAEKNMPAYKAMMQGAQRTMAAQGYTGSGNALAAAASAGGQAYQQDFNNLALLSGAGIQPGSSQTAAAGQIIGSNNQEGGQMAQILGILGQGSGGKSGGGEAASHQGDAGGGSKG